MIVPKVGKGLDRSRRLKPVSVSNSVFSSINGVSFFYFSWNVESGRNRPKGFKGGFCDNFCQTMAGLENGDAGKKSKLTKKSVNAK